MSLRNRERGNRGAHKKDSSLRSASFLCYNYSERLINTFYFFMLIKDKRGFTLIELLISISVVSILLGLSYAGYGRFSQRQNLISAGQTMKNILRDVQSRSFNGEIDCSPTACNCSVTSSNLTDWVVDFSSRTQYGKCEGVSFSSKVFDISPDIIISPYLSPAADKLLFRKLPPSADRSGTICLSDKDMVNSYYRVSVDTSGSISDNGTINETCP